MSSRFPAENQNFSVEIPTYSLKIQGKFIDKQFRHSDLHGVALPWKFFLKKIKKMRAARRPPALLSPFGFGCWFLCVGGLRRSQRCPIHTFQF
jgi:hypothetical protein